MRANSEYARTCARKNINMHTHTHTCSFECCCPNEIIFNSKWQIQFCFFPFAFVSLQLDSFQYVLLLCQTRNKFFLFFSFCESFSICRLCEKPKREDLNLCITVNVERNFLVTNFRLFQNIMHWKIFAEIKQRPLRCELSNSYFHQLVHKK